MEKICSHSKTDPKQIFELAHVLLDGYTSDFNLVKAQRFKIPLVQVRFATAKFAKCKGPIRP